MDDYDREDYEDYLQNSAESQREYEKYKYTQEQEQSMYEEERILQDDLNDAAKEDCHADYSGGKKPTMDCDYSTGSPTKSLSPQESAIFGVGFAIIIIGLVAFFIIKSNKTKR